MSAAAQRFEWEEVAPFAYRFFFHSTFNAELWGNARFEERKRWILEASPAGEPLFVLGQFVFNRNYGRGQVEERVCCRGIWCYRVSFPDYGDRYYAESVSHERVYHEDVITNLSAQPPTLQDQLMPPTEGGVSPSIIVTADGRIVRRD